MSKILPEIDFTPEQMPLRRSVWCIFLSAAVVLLLLLGRNALHGIEGNLAFAIQELTGGTDIFAAENWNMAAEKMPLWFCRGREVAVEFFGNDEFSCRLFSVIAALFCLGGTMRLAHDLFCRRTMYCAAWMLIGSYGFIYWGRHISTYMTLAAWVVWCTYFLCCGKMNFWTRSLICFMLLAGSAWWGMNFILLIPGMFCIAFRRCRNFFTHCNLIPAFFSGAAALLLVMEWQLGLGAVSFTEYLLRLWRQLAGTFQESMMVTLIPDCDDKWYSIFTNLPRLLFPWILPVAVVIIGMVRKWRDLAPDTRSLLLGILLMVLLTGVFPFRRWQYQLPQLPFLLILTAAGVTECENSGSWNQQLTRIMNWGFAVLCSLCFCVFVTWPLWEMVFMEAPPLWIMFGMPLLGLAGLAAVIFDTGRSSKVENVSGMNGAWSGYILAGVCFMVAVFSVGMPSLTRYRSGRPFWKKCGEFARELPAGEVIFCDSNPNPKALYYMNIGRKFTIASDEKELQKILQTASGSQLLLITKREDREAVLKLVQEERWYSDEANPLAQEAKAVDFSADVENINGDKYFLWRIRR